jgi:hypothetical protein
VCPHAGRHTIYRRITRFLLTVCRVLFTVCLFTVYRVRYLEASEQHTARILVMRYYLELQKMQRKHCFYSSKILPGPVLGLQTENDLGRVVLGFGGQPAFEGCTVKNELCDCYDIVFFQNRVALPLHLIDRQMLELQIPSCTEIPIVWADLLYREPEYGVKIGLKLVLPGGKFNVLQIDNAGMAHMSHGLEGTADQEAVDRLLEQIEKDRLQWKKAVEAEQDRTMVRILPSGDLLQE